MQLKKINNVHKAIRVPSGKLECAFYIAVVYSLTADVWGISVPLLAGVAFLGLAGICLLQLRNSATAVYRPIAALIACTMAFAFVQVFIHDLSILDSGLRTFIIWILQLIIVQSLCLRQGFSYRYPLVLCAIAVLALPFLSFDPGEVERARVDTEIGLQGGLSHPGGLSEWFGFFAVFFAICGLGTNRFVYRVGAWAAAVGSLLVVALTVSRGPIFAALLAIVVGFRGILKRGFIPIFALILVSGVAYEAGIFEQALKNYEERSTEETGREILWPAAIDLIFSTPLTPFVGVGMSKALMYVLSPTKPFPPHNAFLYFALASGILPLACFVAFWIRAGWSSAHVKGQEGDAFRIPYLIYAFVGAMLGDAGFMSAWALLALSVAAGSPVFYGKLRLLVVRIGGKVRFAFSSGEKAPRTRAVARYRS